MGIMLEGKDKFHVHGTFFGGIFEGYREAFWKDIFARGLARAAKSERFGTARSVGATGSTLSAQPIDRLCSGSPAE